MSYTHPSTRQDQVKVWDLFVRVFHWSLAGAFLVAYLTEDDLLGLHSYAGYTVLGLITLRLVWGLIGPQHARFSDFVFSKGTIVQYIKTVFRGRPQRYLGHNPAGGLMIIALLFCLLMTGISGMGALAVEENAGPLASMLANSPGWLGEVIEEGHELVANLTLILVFVHVGGVLLESLIHRENLIRAMINGFKKA